MRLQTDNLGKVAITIEKDYYIPDKSYDKLTVVQVKDKFATYVSRKPVPIGACINNREYWIPFSSLKEDVVLDYNAFKDKYGKELVLIKDRLNTLEEISFRYLQLEDKVKELTELAEVNIEKSDDLIERSQAIIEHAENNKAVLNSLPSQILNNTRVEYIQQSDENKLNIVQSEYTKQNDGTYIKQREDTKRLIPLARNTGNDIYVEGLMSANDKQWLELYKPLLKFIENNKFIVSHQGDNPILSISTTSDSASIVYSYYKTNEKKTRVAKLTIPIVNNSNPGLMTVNQFNDLNFLKETLNDKACEIIHDLSYNDYVNNIGKFDGSGDSLNFKVYSRYVSRNTTAIQESVVTRIIPFADYNQNGCMAKWMYTALINARNKIEEAGTANGLAVLDENGKIPANNLPSFVDDVLEYDDYASLPSTGEVGKIYVTLDTNLTYRWSGSQYIEISKSLALGETSSTAFAGDRGKVLETKVQAVESTNTKQDSNINLLANLLLNTSAKVKVSANTVVIEAGVDTIVNIGYNAYVAGKSISPVDNNVKSQSLELGGGITINKPEVKLELLNTTDNLMLPLNVSSDNTNITLNKTTTIQLNGTFKNIGENDVASIVTNSIDKSDFITIHAYYPNYYSYEASDSITIDDIKSSFTKAPLSPILNDEILLSSSQDLNYLYACIPSGIKAIEELTNSVYEVGGLIIPMITISNVSINDKTYVLLRSETKLIGKTINIHVK